MARHAFAPATDELAHRETGDTGMVRAVRVVECSGFFNLDTFGLAPIDRRMLSYQV
jgi:hypothetical protein